MISIMPVSLLAVRLRERRPRSRIRETTAPALAADFHGETGSYDHRNTNSKQIKREPPAQ